MNKPHLMRPAVNPAEWRQEESTADAALRLIGTAQRFARMNAVLVNSPCRETNLKSQARASAMAEAMISLARIEAKGF